jgi:hypothetical protein
MGYRRGTSRTACVEVDVDFDLDDFDEGDLIDYLEDKGYTIIEGKVSTKYETFEQLDKQIWNLYQTFLLDKGDNNNMDRELRNFFAEYYNKVNL